LTQQNSKEYERPIITSDVMLRMPMIAISTSPEESHRGKTGDRRKLETRAGLTAIEVLVALVILSAVAVFSMRAFEHTRRVHLETAQSDCATQVARDILNEIKSGEDWENVKAEWDELSLARYDTEFDIQVQEQPGEEEGVAHLELAISWVSPKGLQQRVFNTSVFDWGTGP
jgi:prepilin-type N-terminal cleavage/methylation domain-containing protein